MLNTEGAIAKYLATEAGNTAAEAAIQAHGGYGYTKEYMVEKIKRDVRITTIYEGTSEIMEMTISRGRWQQHLKTRGTYYVDAADRLDALHASHPDCGAATSALAHRALATLMEGARVHRLTRNQHLLFRIGELVAATECSAALARRAVQAADGTLSAKCDHRLDADALAATSRVFAREAARAVAQDLTSQVVGAAEPGTFEPGALQSSVGLDRILAAQSGLAADMDTVSAAVYAAAAP